MILDVTAAEIRTFVSKCLGKSACKRIRETIAKVQTGRVASHAEIAKRLLGKMGLFPNAGAVVNTPWA